MDPLDAEIARRDRAQASERFASTVAFHGTMRRYARIMLALCALTFALCAWGVARDFRQDARIDRLERILATQ